MLQVRCHQSSADTTAPIPFLTRNVDLHPERPPVSVLTIIQCAGPFIPQPLPLSSDSPFPSAHVSITSRNSRSLSTVASGLHRLGSEASKTTRGKSHAKVVDLLELHPIFVCATHR